MNEHNEHSELAPHDAGGDMQPHTAPLGTGEFGGEGGFDSLSGGVYEPVFSAGA